jgi:hypothetical protein
MFIHLQIQRMQKKTNAQIWVLSILLLTMTVLHITKK